MEKNLETKGKSVQLKLNKEIYLKKAVLMACEAFGESCWVNLDLEKDTFLVRLEPMKGEIDPSVLGHEFFNYVLGIMQNV